LHPARAIILAVKDMGAEQLWSMLKNEDQMDDIALVNNQARMVEYPEINGEHMRGLPALPIPVGVMDLSTVNVPSHVSMALTVNGQSRVGQHVLSR